MKIVLLCGYYEKQYESEVVTNTKGNVEFSANEFQRKIIDGLKKNNLDFDVISAPLIGSYPNRYKKRVFKPFSERDSNCTYVSFNNLWGLRNFSRAKHLKKALGSFIESKDNQKLIIIYSPHTPFLDAAVYAKKKDKNIKLCLVVPDLPQYMNLNAKQSLLYKIGKKLDIKKFYSLNKKIDSYVLLTEQMKDILKVGNRPYIVKEGIVSSEKLETFSNLNQKPERNGAIKYLTYTGKVNFQFGIKELVESFKQIPDEDLHLVICGAGDAAQYVTEESKKDKRIEYKGQVLPSEAQKWMEISDILINPRRGDGEYTKYSFPSKTIDYLLTGNPVIAYYLGGMPEIYKSLIIDMNINDLFEALIKSKNINHNNRECLLKSYFLTLSETIFIKNLLTINFPQINNKGMS